MLSAQRSKIAPRPASPGSPAFLHLRHPRVPQASFLPATRQQARMQRAARRAGHGGAGLRKAAQGGAGLCRRSAMQVAAQGSGRGHRGFQTRSQATRRQSLLWQSLGCTHAFGRLHAFIHSGRGLRARTGTCGRARG